MSLPFRKCLGVLLIAFPVIASAAFFLRGESAYPTLGEEVSFREDAGDEAGFERVLADEEGWVSQRKRTFRGTGDAVRLWAKFDVPVLPLAQRIFVVAGPWERVTYFVVRDGRLVDRQHAGTLVSWTERTTRVGMASPFVTAGLAAVGVPPHARVSVFARLEHGNRFVKVPRLMFSLWDADEVRAGEQRDRLFQGVFVAVMALLILYNLALFALAPSASSGLYHGISLIAISVFWGVFFGWTFEYLWPQRPALDYYSLLICPPLALWSLCQFVRHYLGTVRHFPRADALLKWEARACLLLLPLLWLPVALNQPVSAYVTLVAIVLVASAGIALWFGVTVLALARHHPFARLLLGAILCAGAGAMISFGPLFHWLPATDWTLHAAQIGNALSGVLLSVGLGLRVRQLR